MKYLFLTLSFFLPALTFAATFEIAVDEAVGIGTVYVLPEDETLYTAQMALGYDQNILSVSDIKISEGWMSLEREGYSQVTGGYVLKTAGFPGGISEKTPLLTFSLVKSGGGVASLVIEETSKIYDAKGNNLFSGVVVKTLGTPVVQESPLPQEFSISEAQSPVVIPDVVEEVAPIEEVEDLIQLEAAVISIEGELPILELVIVLLILLLGVGTTIVIRLRKKSN